MMWKSVCKTALVRASYAGEEGTKVMEGEWKNGTKPPDSCTVNLTVTKRVY